ncbi:MAG: dTMP kinase [Methanobacteriaceae archaeon]|jgi:dTMP kinase|nr:dTMP kinase [Candidatus Methanorudis spinitermitis]
MYICLEGIDGTGKSTQIELLSQWLIDSGFKVKKVVEPTGSEIGLLIRKILTSPDATSSNTQKILALLFAADRLTLMEKISKYEKENKIVISDRSFYSSLAYQNSEDWILEINKFVKTPDLAILLDLDVNLAISRCLKTDEFEKKSFLINVREKYIELAKNNKNNFKIVNANNGENKVNSDIKKVVASLLGICVDGID